MDGCAAMKWWAYLHTSGVNNIHVKPYMGVEDITEAQQSPFVARICPPFDAEGPEAARRHAEEHFKPKTEGETHGNHE